MSNMTLNCLQSLWNLSFLKPGDLRKTSLNHPTSPEHSFKIHLNQVQYEAGSPKLTSSTRIQTSSLETKKDLDTPVRAEKEKGIITEKDFRIMQILRSGKNFRIYMVRKENDDRVYAMKLIGKKKIVKNSITDQVAVEKEILEKAKHPFIPKLDWYFENDKKVFFVMEFVEGGACLDLILKQLSRFSEEITRFYCAEVLTILEYLHSDLKMTYNDLKLRNLLLDPQGHIKLIGYGLAKRIQFDQQQSPNASPVSRLTSSEEIDDFWGFGCLLYELLTGRKPFSATESDGSDSEVVSPTSNLYWPCPVSKNAKDLITRLLSRDLENRMKLDEIKQHAFFAQVNWEKIIHKSIYPPLIPSQFKDAEKEQEEYGDDDNDNRIKYLQVPSLEKIIEDSSSQFNSDDGFTAMSYDRKSRLNSILGYH